MEGVECASSHQYFIIYRRCICLFICYLFMQQTPTIGLSVFVESFVWPLQHPTSCHTFQSHCKLKEQQYRPTVHEGHSDWSSAEQISSMKFTFSHWHCRTLRSSIMFQSALGSNGILKTSCLHECVEQSVRNMLTSALLHLVRFCSEWMPARMNLCNPGCYGDNNKPAQENSTGHSDTLPETWETGEVTDKQVFFFFLTSLLSLMLVCSSP